MPYMTIYLAKDGKWHTRDCPLLPPDTWTNEHQIIGSTGMKPGPTRDDMCKKCWSFLFPANSASKEGEACSTPSVSPAYICEQCGCGMSILPPPEVIDEMKPSLLCPICLAGVQFDRQNASSQQQAVARCSHCKRYTTDKRALLADPPPCQCGWQYGWSGSFDPPTEASEWSTHNGDVSIMDRAEEL